MSLTIFTACIFGIFAITTLIWFLIKIKIDGSIQTSLSLESAVLLSMVYFIASWLCCYFVFGDSIIASSTISMVFSIVIVFTTDKCIRYLF